MAMNADVLGSLMQTNIDALTDEQKKGRVALYQALAASVIEHIQGTATIVNLTIVGTSATGGPVTGTATGGPGSIL